MTTHIKQLHYEGLPVFFDVSNLAQVYFNATEVAKKYHKRPVDFLRVEETQDYMNALLADLNANSDVGLAHITPEQLVITLKGNHADGRQQGTWMRQEMAFVFARWLSPAFAVWMDKTLRGMLHNLPQLMAEAKRFQAMRAIEAQLTEVQRQGRQLRKSRRQLIEEQPAQTRLFEPTKAIA